MSIPRSVLRKNRLDQVQAEADAYYGAQTQERCLRDAEICTCGHRRDVHALGLCDCGCANFTKAIELDLLAILNAIDGEIIAGHAYPILKVSQAYADQEKKKSKIDPKFLNGAVGYMLGCEVHVDDFLSGDQWLVSPARS